MSKWTEDVRSLLKSHILGKTFTNEGFWQECEIDLRRLHPNNNNLRAKIRQQFQILRDKGELRHGKKPGQWTKVK